MKLYDKISLRAYSLKMALDNDRIGTNPDKIIQTAKAFEMYIQGDVKLPDFMPVSDCNTNVHICNGCAEEYDDDEDDGIGLD